MAAEEIIKSQGTELYFVKPTAHTVERVVCATSISGLGGARDQIDITCLDNAGDREFVAGLGNPGQVSVAFNVHKNEVAHEDLLALKESGATVSWGIYSSDGATAPTVDSSGTLQSVTGRASAIFEGYVSDINIDIQGNDIWKGTITIQRSGKVSFDLSTV
ncbi:phage tail tube protein [Pandoraea sputorum]|uniref:phage tail tube protein n=1 Tax=Pandoraea sputorum TaxID=93222 RepID=UPI001241A397|nr:phage tail tube protein [Pandoraea sputorum]VVE82610.1 phage major tail 2 family protein [Pandoraea sputorum]